MTWDRVGFTSAHYDVRSCDWGQGCRTLQYPEIRWLGSRLHSGRVFWSRGITKGLVWMGTMVE